jgi:hypothetical protein
MMRVFLANGLVALDSIPESGRREGLFAQGIIFRALPANSKAERLQLQRRISRVIHQGS